MIDKRTVLVLGAGASMDFGFPSGWGLFRRVAALTMRPSKASPAFNSLGFRATDCERFASALVGSGARSVDAFLARRQDLVDLGKAAIAAALIPCETPEKVFEDGLKQDAQKPPAASWLRWLFERMAGRTKEQWATNQLAIITFNYDRVVEFFLHSALMHNYTLSSAEAGALLQRTVTIVHAHGQLGQFPDAAQGEGESRPFNGDLSSGSVSVGAAGIKILHEGAAGDEAFQRARTLLAWAESVVFLGFGFHPDNMARLELSRILAGKSVMASMIGMEPREIELAVQGAGNVGHDTSCTTLVDLLRRHTILGN